MRRIILAVLLVTPCGFFAFSGENKPASTGSLTAAFMRQKLTYSDRILEGLVLENFGLVTTNAMMLRNMSLTNAFVALNNQEYLRGVSNFQAKVDFLIESAKKQDLAAATDAYGLLSKSCVSCHQQFRRVQYLKATQEKP